MEESGFSVSEFSLTIRSRERCLDKRYNRNVETILRKYTSFDEMKADEYRYWQSRPVHERMDAVSEMSLAAYAMKGAAPDVPRLQGPLIRLQRPQR